MTLNANQKSRVKSASHPCEQNSGLRSDKQLLAEQTTESPDWLARNQPGG